MHYIINGLLVELSDNRPAPASAVPARIADPIHFAKYRHLYKVRGRRLLRPTEAEIAEYEGLLFSPEELRALKELAARHLGKKE
jgi:hypothetical protein